MTGRARCQQVLKVGVSLWMPNKRASATFEINFDREEITAVANGGQEFVLDLDEVRLELAGATGKMLFIRSTTDETILFSEDPNLSRFLGKPLCVGMSKNCWRSVRRAIRWAGYYGVVCLRVVVVALGLFASIQALSGRLVGFIPIEVDVKLGEFVGDAMDKEGPEVKEDVIVCKMVNRWSIN